MEESAEDVGDVELNGTELKHANLSGDRKEKSGKACLVYSAASVTLARTDSNWRREKVVEIRFC